MFQNSPNLIYICFINWDFYKLSFFNIVISSNLRAKHCSFCIKLSLNSLFSNNNSDFSLKLTDNVSCNDFYVTKIYYFKLLIYYSWKTTFLDNLILSLAIAFKRLFFFYSYEKFELWTDLIFCNYVSKSFTLRFRLLI